MSGKEATLWLMMGARSGVKRDFPHPGGEERMARGGALGGGVGETF